MQLTLIALALSAAAGSSPQETPLATSRLAIVLDGETGRPIPGATVYAVQESEIPVWGKRWFRAAVVTDADGRARVPQKSEVGDYSWLMAEAEGYGTCSTSDEDGPEPAEFRLERETPITIEVVDFLGRPLPLAHLGVCFGCGHTPDLVSAVTGPDGRATLFGVTDYDGGIEDLYVVHPELSQPSYDSVPYGDVVDGVARYHGEPGFVVTGCVLLPSGKPAVGHGVGNNETHRGHWAVTDERGEFRLFGCEPLGADSLMVVTPGEERRTFFHGALPDVYRTLQLDGTDQPEAFVDGQEGTKLPTAIARVQITAPNPQDQDLPARLQRIVVEAWEETTGMAFWGETDASGAVDFELPAGRYAVRVDGPASPYPAVMAGRVTVEPGENEAPITLTCDLPTPRVCSLEVLGLRPGESLELMTAAGPYLLHDLPEGPEIRVPTFLLPSGRWSAYTYRAGEDGVQRRLQIPVSRDIMATLELRVPE
ncbi:carboxypeptidase-like regulatory domain-containing protein [Planctomycetes bacterium Poly30]